MGFNVTMYNLINMSMVKRITNLTCKVHSFFNLQRGSFFNYIVQSNAFYIFHDNIMHFKLLANIIDADYIGMRKRSSRLGFTTKSTNKLLVIHILLSKHFNSHVAI